MKILFVLPYSPVPPTFGGALRVYHLIRLAARHHDVSIVSFGFPTCESDLRQAYGTQIRDIHIVQRHWPRKLWRFGQLYSLFTKHSFFYLLGHYKGVQKKLNEVLNTSDFDIVQTEFAHMASYELNTNAVRILDSHNVEYDNFRQMWRLARSPLKKLFYYLEYKKFYREEAEACLQSNAILVTSPVDKQILDADVPSVKKYVVSNGVDASYFTPSSDSPEPKSLVFTGMMSYVPNSDGIDYFLDKIFPLIVKQIPEVKVYIVGNQPPEWLRRKASGNIIITGFVDDVRPYIHRSSVYIVPLRMGSGTRLKVTEAMAMKKPIVTTSVGCEGINVVNGESALIADDPESFAENVIKLLNDQMLQRKLADNGYEIMRREYEWSVVGDRLEEVYKTLVAEKDNTSVSPSTRVSPGSVKILGDANVRGVKNNGH